LKGQKGVYIKFGKNLKGKDKIGFATAELKLAP
jgi:hypothetical protein